MASVELDYRPLQVYAGFHRSPSFERTLFGGFGSGKTRALCGEAWTVGFENPGARILMTRKTIPELRDTLEPEFEAVAPTALWERCEVRRGGGHLESVTLPNGTKYLFRSIDDWRKLKSMNLAWIFWDELNEYDEETYLAMLGRLRQREPTKEGKDAGAREIVRRGSCAATNVAGHDWCWRRFVSDQRPAGADYWTATSLENPYLGADYIQRLLAYPDPWIKRYVLAQFDDFAGQIYEDWSESSHMLPGFEWDWGEVMWMGMDPGTRVSTAGLWVVLDTTNYRLVAVDEYQEPGMSTDVHARAWREMEARQRRPVRWRVADPAITTRDRGTMMSLHSQYRRLGFNFDLGPQRHRDRIPMLGKLIATRRIVATPATPQFFEQVRNYRWADITPAQRARGEDPPEQPVKANDHLVDCAQYLSSRWVKPMGQRTTQRQLSDSEQLARDVNKSIKEQLQRGRMGVPNDLGALV